MIKLYPLKFIPRLKEKIWGGRKLVDRLSKQVKDDKLYGESWEISTVPGDISLIANGSQAGLPFTELIDKDPKNILGTRVLEKFGSFPLLIKFLDAQQDLSIQVHPDDELAKLKHNSAGKSEMWHILEADNGAKLVKGFSKQTDSDTVRDLISNGNLDSILNKKEVQKHDTFYIPAGTIHNIGKGILLAEIQQSSDVTYRIDDFGRKDDNGNPRALHIEDSLDALNYKNEEQFSIKSNTELNQFHQLVKSPFFHTRKITSDENISLNYGDKGSFTIMICIEGEGLIEGDFHSEKISLGDSILFPASIDKFNITTQQISLLECRIP